MTERPIASPGTFLVVRHEKHEWWPQTKHNREWDAVSEANNLNDKADPIYGISYVAYDDKGFPVSGKVLT